MSTPLDRRTLLGAGGAVGLAALASACGGDAAAPPAAAPPTAAPTSAAPTGAAPTGAAPAAALARLGDIPVGGAVAVKAPDGSEIVVARPTSTTAAAFSAKCTHRGCTVAPAGKELHCPCHGSRYAAATGAVLQGPAKAPLAAFAVHVVAGEVRPA